MSKKLSGEKQLEEAFQRAIQAVDPERPYYSTPTKEPLIRRKVSSVFRKHLVTRGDDFSATNATIDEIGGLFDRAKDPGATKRKIVGNLLRRISPGITRAHAKKTGKMVVMEVRSIDAWRDENGWSENQSFTAGKLELLPHSTDRMMLKAMREQGYLAESSAGKVAVEDLQGDPTYYWIVNRSTREPLFSVTASRNKGE